MYTESSGRDRESRGSRRLVVTSNRQVDAGGKAAGAVEPFQPDVCRF